MKLAITVAVVSFLAAGLRAQIQPGVPPGIGFEGVISIANLGVFPPPSAIEFSPNGSTLYVGGAGNSAGSVIHALPVLRAPVTNMILGFGPSTTLSPSPYIDAGLQFGPGGVLFFAEYPPNMLGEIVGGVVHEFPLPPQIGSPGGLTFIPAGMPGAGTLLISAWASGDIYEVGLTPSGNGTFTPTTATLYASTGVNDIEAIRFVPAGPYTGDLLFEEFNSPDAHVRRIHIDPMTGGPVGGASSPAISDLITNLPYQDGMAFDPLTNELFVTDWLVFGLFRFNGFETLQSLTENKTTFSVGGDSALFSLRAGSLQAGQAYFLVASASGTTPGTNLGPVTVPLNIDAVTYATLQLANTPFLPSSTWVLSPTGESLAGLNVPSGVLPPSAIGSTLHWAYAVLDYNTLAPLFASNPVPLTIIP